MKRHLLKRWFPILEWLPRYERQHLRADLVAGLTVGFMLIPQGMAYALLAGMPPIYGLYASTVPMLIYAIFGTSRQLSVGPVAMDSLLVAAGLSAFAVPGSGEWVGLAILLAMVVGLTQFLAGALRLGFLVNFVSQPVISGFTSAAAIVIGLSQAGHLLGVALPRSEYAHEMLYGLVLGVPKTHLPTLVLGVLGVALILGLRKWNKAIPGALLAVLLATLGVWLFDLDTAGIKTVGAIPAGLPRPALPEWNWKVVKDLLPTALTLTLVAFMEAYSIGKALEGKYKDHRIRPNQELKALGLGNLVGALFQAFPTAGGFSRTAVNAQAGARTSVSGVVAAGFIFLTLAFLTPLFHDLPQSILASVIMVAVFGLIDLKAPVRLWMADRVDFGLLLATFGATLVLGIMPGIGIGVLLSLGTMVYRSATPHIAILGRLPGTMHFRNLSRFPEAVASPEVLALRLDAQLFFANANYFRDRLFVEVDRKGAALKMVLIDAEAINFMDSTGVETLRAIHEELASRGVILYISGAKGPVRDTLHRSGLIKVLGRRAIYVHASEAVEAWERVQAAIAIEEDSRAVQTNFKEGVPRRERRVFRRRKKPV